MKVQLYEESPAVVELAANNTVQLPDNLLTGLRAGERFVVIRNGDTILLKRISLRRITDIVAETPSSEPPLSLDEINEIVHEVRRQQVKEA